MAIVANKNIVTSKDVTNIYKFSFKNVDLKELVHEWSFFELIYKNLVKNNVQVMDIRTVGSGGSSSRGIFSNGKYIGSKSEIDHTTLCIVTFNEINNEIIKQICNGSNNMYSELVNRLDHVSFKSKSYNASELKIQLDYYESNSKDKPSHLIDLVGLYKGEYFSIEKAKADKTCIDYMHAGSWNYKSDGAIQSVNQFRESIRTAGIKYLDEDIWCLGFGWY